MLPSTWPRHKPEAVLVLQREHLACDLIGGRDYDYAAEVAGAKEAGLRQPCVPVAATDPLYILYTSGTTGQPKGVVRDTGGHMVALHWSMKNIYGVDPGETYWAASDVGWVVGHSYIVYAPLLAGNTTILFEGKPVGTPDAATFWRVMAKHKVAAFFTAPTAFRAIKAQDREGALVADHDLSSLRTIFLAGERADPDTIHWLERVSGKPVIDHWWQTETGWTIAGNPVGIERLPTKYGSPAVPMPGYDMRVLDDEGVEVSAGTLGQCGRDAAAAAGCAADALAGGRAVSGSVSGRISGLLPHVRRGVDGRGRLPVHHGAHRRHHQRGGPPAFHRRDGGDRCRTPRRRRMRGGRCGG